MERERERETTTFNTNSKNIIAGSTSNAIRHFVTYDGKSYDLTDGVVGILETLVN